MPGGGCIMKSESKTVILCLCSHAGKVQRDKALRLATAARRASADVVFVPDFCRYAALNSSELADLVRQKGAENVAVAACHKRAVTSLLQYAADTEKSPSLFSGVKVFNMVNGSVEDIISELGFTPVTEPDTDFTLPESDGEWVPWFPVIDRSRCVDCGKCADFCIFGVYSVENGRKVRVSSPASCKNQCPACARICPKLAIIFPKHASSPIDGGLAEDDKNVRLSQDNLFSGGNFAEKLAMRRKKASGGIFKKEDEK